MLAQFVNAKVQEAPVGYGRKDAVPGVFRFFNVVIICVADVDAVAYVLGALLVRPHLEDTAIQFHCDRDHIGYFSVAWRHGLWRMILSPFPERQVPYSGVQTTAMPNALLAGCGIEVPA